MYWYLIHTKPRQEQSALQNLQQQGYTCYLPIITQKKNRQGKISIVNEPLFPRYLFIQLGEDKSDKSWVPIRSTRGVSRLVSFGTNPARVDERLIALLCEQEACTHAQPEPLFQPGEHVRLTNTPFAGLDAVYQMTDGNSRVMVLIELLSKQVRLQVSLSDLCKV